MTWTTVKYLGIGYVVVLAISCVWFYYEAKNAPEMPCEHEALLGDDNDGT